MENLKNENGVIKCICPDCNALSNFNFKDSSSEYGHFIIGKHHKFNDVNYSRIIYQLFSCSGCGRGGIAKIHCNNSPTDGEIEDFYPKGIEKAKLPADVPIDIIAELREAEICASASAWRAGSAMLRSMLEKVFIANNYNEKDLYKKIEAANKDGIITDSRATKAHEDIRVLGNDVLHDTWKEVTPEEFNLSYHYCHRIIEDFYDDRKVVEDILKKAGRIGV